MSEVELAVIWGAISIAGFVVAGIGLVEGLFIAFAAALCVGLAFVVPPVVGLIVFVVLVALAIPLTRLVLRRTRYYGSDSATRAGQLVGQTGVVVAPIADSKEPGRVRVAGEELPAKIMFDHHGPVHLGTKVVVDRVDEGVLVVAPHSALRERYARGEITYAELEQFLEDEPT